MGIELSPYDMIVQVHRDDRCLRHRDRVQVLRAHRGLLGSSEVKSKNQLDKRRAGSVVESKLSSHLDYFHLIFSTATPPPHIQTLTLKHWPPLSTND